MPIVENLSEQSWASLARSSATCSSVRSSSFGMSASSVADANPREVLIIPQRSNGQEYGTIKKKCTPYREVTE